ncbi:hypothetical protein PM082_000120 [Marasmius tenuissimus]|nr:hypothetical protein PM082_000120 [Marasmius tenuissimus]
MHLQSVDQACAIEWTSRTICGPQLFLPAHNRVKFPLATPLPRLFPSTKDLQEQASDITEQTAGHSGSCLGQTPEQSPFLFPDPPGTYDDHIREFTIVNVQVAGFEIQPASPHLGVLGIERTITGGDI